MENNVRKGEIACNKQFLLFSQCFLPDMILIFHFRMSSAIYFDLDQSEVLSSGNGLNTFILSSATAFNLEQSEILLFGKELYDRLNGVLRRF